MLQFSVSQGKKKKKQEAEAFPETAGATVFIYAQVKNLCALKGIHAAKGCLNQTRQTEEEKLHCAIQKQRGENPSN